MTGETENIRAARKRVLLADCHEEAVTTLQNMLENAGFETTAVWTAKQALELLECQHFDLMLLNEYLPDAECEDLLRKLHKQGTLIPCIVMQPSAPEITNCAHLEALGVREIVYKHEYRTLVNVVSEHLLGESKTHLATSTPGACDRL